MVKFKDLLKEVILEGNYENLDEENIEEGVIRDTILATLLSLGLNNVQAKNLANKVPKDKIETVSREIKKINPEDSAKLKKVEKAITGAEDENLVIKQLTKPTGYVETTEQQRKDWNNYVEYLEGKGLAGSTKLDRGSAGGSTVGKDELKKYLAANPSSTLSLDMVPNIQYEFELLRYGKDGFGISEKGFKRLRQILNITVPVTTKTAASPIDRNSGSYTTSCRYPASGSAGFNIKKMAARYESMSDDEFQEALNRAIKMNKAVRERNPGVAEKEQDFLKQHAQKQPKIK